MTFAVIGKCPETGQIGVGVATFSVNVGRVSPVVHGVFPTYQDDGAIVLPHSYANPQLAHDTFRMLDQNLTLEQIKTELPKTDQFFSYRQLSILTTKGEIWVHTGEQAFTYAGHIISDSWAASGNALVGRKVVEGMAEAMETSRGEALAERLLSALEAGRDAGGQADAETGKHFPELSTVLYVVDDQHPSPQADLRVDYHPESIAQLRRLYEYTKPLEHYYEGMQHHPDTFWDFVKSKGVLKMPHFHEERVDIEKG